MTEQSDPIAGAALMDDRMSRQMQVLVDLGVAYRHEPGPPINEAWWLEHGIITTAVDPCRGCHLGRRGENGDVIHGGTCEP